MSVTTFTVTRNSAVLMPFFLRHYGEFAERMVFFDDRSTDNTRSIIVSHPKAELFTYPPDTGIDEDEALKLAHDNYKNTNSDWSMWVDDDEFIYHPTIEKILDKAKKDGFQAIWPDGFNMMCEGVPLDNGRQIWQIANMGVESDTYSKPVIVRPNCDITWVRGKHMFDVGCEPMVSNNSGIKLLHYRYLGYDYTKKRNDELYSRSKNKGAAWTCAPDWEGLHSPKWAVEQMKQAKQVVYD